MLNGYLAETQRVHGRKDLWAFRVHPYRDDEDGVVHFTLHGNLPCGDPGGICHNGDRLRVTRTISIPPVGVDVKAPPGWTGSDSVSVASIEDVSVDEGVGTLGFTITLNRATRQPASVYVSTYSASGDTATLWRDYREPSNRKVTFPANSRTRTVQIPIIDDHDVEGAETFTVMLYHPENLYLEGEGALQNTSIRATVTINASY